MADNRVIKTAVRIPAKRSEDGKRVLEAPRSYRPGQEDELAAALTPEQGARLVERGALAGKWEFTGSADSRSTATDSTATDNAGSSNQSTPAAGSANTEAADAGLDDEIVLKLQENFENPAAVSAATDEELLAIEGIGKKTLEKIRKAYPASE